MNVREIVQKYLVDNDYDGLFQPDGECACKSDDLFTCLGEAVDECEAGHLVDCPGCEDSNEPHWHIRMPAKKEG